MDLSPVYPCNVIKLIRPLCYHFLIRYTSKAMGEQSRFNKKIVIHYFQPCRSLTWAWNLRTAARVVLS